MTTWPSSRPPADRRHCDSTSNGSVFNLDKIKAAVAEAAAKAHFPELGYTVHSLGIEHLLPSDMLHSINRGSGNSFVNEYLLRFMTMMPDLIAVRERVESGSTRCKASRDIMLIEVKYRSDATLSTSAEECEGCKHAKRQHLWMGLERCDCLVCRYQEILTFGARRRDEPESQYENVIFYLVARRVRFIDGDLLGKSFQSKILVNIPAHGEWLFATDIGRRLKGQALQGVARYFATARPEGTTFAEIAEEIEKRSLQPIFGRADDKDV